MPEMPQQGEDGCRECTVAKIKKPLANPFYLGYEMRSTGTMKVGTVSVSPRRPGAFCDKDVVPNPVIVGYLKLFLQIYWRSTMPPQEFQGKK
jgi:hypothetical protein